MVLGEGFVDAKGERHAMLGLIGLETSFAARKLHLGYRETELLCDCVPGGRGSVFAGHGFHYASILLEVGEPLFRISDASGSPVDSAGLRNGNVRGSFFHLIAARNTGLVSLEFTYERK